MKPEQETKNFMLLLITSENSTPATELSKQL
jgi:hypothetical protein